MRVFNLLRAINNEGYRRKVKDEVEVEYVRILCIVSRCLVSCLEEFHLII